MNNILKASYITLNNSKGLLSKLTDEEFCNEDVSPYYSSIGSHLRHILDFYNCIFMGVDNGIVDLTSRERSLIVERDCSCASEYLNSILSKLNSNQFNINDSILVIDDLGQGEITIDYTIGALFAQANSHTIHHYAIINYILDRLGIKMTDENFGFNPTSPKKELSRN